jgi:hypothetical protein
MDLKKLDFAVGDALVGEAKVRPGAFKAFLQTAVLPHELLDAALERDVLGCQRLNGLSGNHLIEVAEGAGAVTLAACTTRTAMASEPAALP